MKKIILYTIIATSLLLSNNYAKANSNNTVIKKIGIINPINIYQSVPQGERRVQALKSKIKPQKDKLQKQQEDILQEKHQFQNEAPSMTVEDIKKRQAKNNHEENQFQKELIDFQKNSIQQEQIIAQNFQEDFNKAVEIIAAQDKYDLILSSHAIAYSDVMLNIDITEEVIEKMKDISNITNIDNNHIENIN